MKNNTSWFSGQITKLQKEFTGAGNKPIYFKDYDQYIGNGWVEISKGCIADFYKISDSHIRIFCKMGTLALDVSNDDLPSILNIHYHPDYDEIFTTITGEIIDLESNSIVNKDNPFYAKAGVSHTMSCPNYWHGQIDCYLITDKKK